MCIISVFKNFKNISNNFSKTLAKFYQTAYNNVVFVALFFCGLLKLKGGVS